MECLIDRIRALLDRQPCVTVAIEGGSAGGKTTLAARLQKELDANVFHMDDFFLQPHQRTEERFREPGGNVDYERFLKEVLLPLQKGEPFSYRVFDCSVMDFGACVQVTPRRVNIVEGAYSMHPALAPYYDLSVFVTIDPDTQRERILRRNGERMLRRFLEEWIPLEIHYFNATQAAQRCTLRIKGE